MTEINTLAYLNTNDNSALVTTKPYTDNNCGFNDVFETANKAYSKNDTADTKKVDYSKDKNKPVEKKDKTTTEEKNNDSTNKVDENENNKSDDAKTEKVKEKNSDSDTNTKAENTEKTNVSDEIKEAAQEIKTAVQDVVAALKETLIGAQAQIQQAAPKNDSAVDATLVSQANLKTEKQIETKVQPQTQQVLLNLNAETTATPTTQTKDATAKTPLVQAQANVATDANKNSNKESVKEALESANLTQDLLDKTNAQVISVETSSTSNNSLNGNAQEQGVKIALENVNATTNEGHIQTNFDKTINNIQEPKEINKSDILSQVNAKLEQFKDESTTKVTIVLKPENLGKIHLELVNGKDGLTASMTAENAQVKDILDKSLESLKNSLGSQGVNVNNVTVKVAETQQTTNDMFTFDQRNFEQNNQQQFQNNPKNTESGELTHEEEFINKALTSENDDPSKSVSHEGQVDYKI